MIHRSVFIEEVLSIFEPKGGGVYIDATVNGGGHALEIIEKIGISGKLLGIDRDCEILSVFQGRIDELRKKNVRLVCDNFVNIESIARRHYLGPVDGILFDLGVSSYHFEKSGRGFSFLNDEPLDMRFNPKDETLTAAAILNHWPERRIESILREFGEEGFSRRIAKAIVAGRRVRQFKTSVELVDVLRRAVPAWYRRGRIHFATKTFQALRIAVNSELFAVEQGIRGAMKTLRSGGKLIVISFHSLEDRIVKNLFREYEKNGYADILFKKPLRPTTKEVMRNPRARSARLRAVQKA